MGSRTQNVCVNGFVLALPIFPGGLPPSIVGAEKLNYRVRDGNGWTLFAINTNFFKVYTLKTEQWETWSEVLR